MKHELNQSWLAKCNSKNIKQFLREKELLESFLNSVIRDLELEYQKIPKELLHDGVIVGIVKSIDIVKRVKP